MIYVTITQTRSIVVPVDPTIASSPAQAVSFVATEYENMNHAALSRDSDWDIVKTSYSVYNKECSREDYPV